MNIYEGYERLVGCILARNADEFYAFYGGCKNVNAETNADRGLWRYINKPLKNKAERRKTNDTVRKRDAET